MILALLVQHTEVSSISHEDFFQKALTAAGEWTRFADPKTFGVLVFLGLGFTDLVKYANQLFYGYSTQTFAGWVATVSFVVACVLAFLTVTCASFALFPRLRPMDQPKEERRRSLFYFNGIANFENPTAYEEEVRSKTERELEGEIASQAWEVAKVAADKHRWAQFAYVCVILFLVCWAVARIGLSFVA